MPQGLIVVGLAHVLSGAQTLSSGCDAFGGAYPLVVLTYICQWCGWELPTMMGITESRMVLDTGGHWGFALRQDHTRVRQASTHS